MNKKRELVVPFNKPFVVGKELHYIAEAVTCGNISGDGKFTAGCARLLEEAFGIHRVLMTPSCTAALEMAAMLCDLGPGDEVIMPSYTFVSTANAVVRTGARPVFVDVRADTLNIDENLIEDAISSKTRAIFPVHYAGVACEMDRIMDIAMQHDLMVVEDAAQGVNSRYKGRALGSIGHFGAFSFHETKNYICGEGGALCINAPEFVHRAEIIRDKGTNRQQFFRGHVDKYTWVECGSSYVPSEITSAFLFGQLEMFDSIATRRREIYETYYRQLEPYQGFLRLPVIPNDCETNYHMFYVLLQTNQLRDDLLEWLGDRGINSVFHYVPLHSSPMGRRLSTHEIGLSITDKVSRRLIRLPLFYSLERNEQQAVIDAICEFAEARREITPSKLHSGGIPTRDIE